MRPTSRSLLAVVAVIGALSIGGQRAGAETPAPAGATPSAIAKQVCSTKAQHLIADVLGERASVSKPTWHHHLYACDYRYAHGTMVLSVKELSSWSATFGYFDGLGRSLHKTLPILELGQGAFRVRNGSMVVRKDWKVLLVNVSGLPSRFGKPPTTVAGVALAVAGVILGCWHGD